MIPRKALAMTQSQINFTLAQRPGTEDAQLPSSFLQVPAPRSLAEHPLYSAQKSASLPRAYYMRSSAASSCDQVELAVANCDPDQLEFNIQLDISSCGSARAILTATETRLYFHGGGSWKEGETTGFWFFSPLPSYRYGNVTPCLLPQLRQIRVAHKPLGTR